MSVGGAVGGFFNAIIAPLIFPGVWEFYIALVLSCFVRPVLLQTNWTDNLLTSFPGVQTWAREQSDQRERGDPHEVVVEPVLGGQLHRDGERACERGERGERAAAGDVGDADREYYDGAFDDLLQPAEARMEPPDRGYVEPVELEADGSLVELVQSAAWHERCERGDHDEAEDPANNHGATDAPLPPAEREERKQDHREQFCGGDETEEDSAPDRRCEDEQEDHEQQGHQSVIGVGEQPQQRRRVRGPRPGEREAESPPRLPAAQSHPERNETDRGRDIEEDRRRVRRRHVTPDAVPGPQRLERDVREVRDRPVRVTVRRRDRVERLSVVDRVSSDDRGDPDVDHLVVDDVQHDACRDQRENSHGEHRHRPCRCAAIDARVLPESEPEHPREQEQQQRIDDEDARLEVRVIEQVVRDREHAEQEQRVEMPEPSQSPRIEEQREEHHRENEDHVRRVEEREVVAARSEIQRQRAAPDRRDPTEAIHVDLRLRCPPVQEGDRPMRARVRADPDLDRVFQRVQPSVERGHRRSLLGCSEHRDRIVMEVQRPMPDHDGRLLGERRGRDVRQCEGVGRPGHDGGRRRRRWAGRQRKHRKKHTAATSVSPHGTGIGQRIARLEIGGFDAAPRTSRRRGARPRDTSGDGRTSPLVCDLKRGHRSHASTTRSAPLPPSAADLVADVTAAAGHVPICSPMCLLTNGFRASSAGNSSYAEA